MAKGKKVKKKKNMKLRRQLRKTLGCLFMISAIIVTAIPVQPLEAADSAEGWDTAAAPWVTSKTNNGGTGGTPVTDAPIPYLNPSDTTVYQDEDGNFQFAYVDRSGATNSTDKNKFAVIVGYNKAQELTNKTLKIPRVLDAYIKYTDTGTSGSDGFAAAGKTGVPLYYKATTRTKYLEESPTESMLNPDGSRTPVMVEKTRAVTQFKPCTPGSKSEWHRDGVDEPLYYYTKNAEGIPPAAALTDDMDWAVAIGDTGRITGASVKYIANQYAAYDNTANKWKMKDFSSTAESVFGGTGEGKAAANIVNLVIEENLLGVGNYAFYNCFNLDSVTFGDGLNVIGNYAFANCGNLTTVNLEYNANLDTLGDHAFYMCGMLKKFRLPTVTRAIGDSCFEKCDSLTEIDMDLKDKNMNLQLIGYKAFKDCTSLQSLTLPKKYEGATHDNKKEFHLSTVQGCRSLRFISSQSEVMNFVTDKTETSGAVDGNYGWDEFIADVGDEFYFEAPGYVGAIGTSKTPIHNTANVKQIAFKYLGEDKYEIVKTGKDTTGSDVGLVYAVDSSGNLIVFRVEDTDGNAAKVKVPELILPEKIGPYGITTIAAGSFSDNCWVIKVTIPASVENINAGAFKGCHNLRDVIFTDAARINNIGNEAFATQKIRTSSPSHADGGQDGNSCGKPDSELFSAAADVFLSFSGAIEKADGKNTEPFKYAMKESSRINEGRQPVTYITYYSGIPSNLTVKYNPAIGAAELQNFPTVAEVQGGFVKTPAGTDPVTPAVYLYPYITGAISTEAITAFSAANPTENQAGMKDAVYNIKIPNGVTAIRKGLFSGLDENGYMVALDAAGNLIFVNEGGNMVTEGVKPGATYDAPAKDVQSVSTKSLDTILPYTFAELPALQKIMISGASTLGDYSFANCENLHSADISPDLMNFGLRPFKGCPSLGDTTKENATGVTFTDSTYFTYADGIIYGLTNGEKTKIVECLESRGGSVGSRAVGPDELIGIKEIADEAFMGNDKVSIVDLSKTGISTVPKRCFAEMDKLFQVILPDTTKKILDGSFWNTKSLAFVTVPGSVTSIAPNAFGYTTAAEGAAGYGEEFVKDRKNDNFEFVCLPDTAASDYAEIYDYIGTTTSADLKIKYSVFLFYTLDEVELVPIEELRVPHGEDVELPAPPSIEGYTFVRWSPSEEIYNPIVADTQITAIYKANDAATYKVEFIDWDDKVIVTRDVVEGEAAEAPPEPTREGYIFKGWRPSNFSKVTENMKIYAEYEAKDPTKYAVTFYDEDGKTVLRREQVEPGGTAVPPEAPAKEGYTFTGWVPADGYKNVQADISVYAQYKEGSGTDDPNDPNKPTDPNDPNNNNNNNGNKDENKDKDKDKDDSSSDNSVSGNAKKYKVTVHGGSGSGDYTPGTIININAYATADGKVFDKWTSSSYGVGFVNAEAISTTFTMPSNDVEITANLKTGKATSSVSSNSRSRDRNTATTVDITKSGISNTGLASANVNGSSDNYVIRITEDAQATAAVIAALENKYGDLSNIAYLPMDISMYDSTGQTKITDVSGITVDITLPLPDDLIQYAGNNRAASVVNGQLEELPTKFTTIDGIACAQFTATHFSPYTIYVDKGNLTEGTIDATPKTGDPIHPKWFLAMGLACISIILFCKKDKGQPKVKTA